jgi:tRNA-uridine 2-sulfurtransferase
MKILVGFSGGVDSAASIKLLKSQGNDVSAITLPICGGTNISQVKKLAKELDVELHLLTDGSIFRENVIEYFIESNKNGLTPNPCIPCNEHVKFKSIYDFATQNNFDKIATGHYSNIVTKFGRKRISKGDDTRKDQSYVLSRVPEEIVNMLIFPMSNLTRAEAEELVAGLSTLKPSQDACFAMGDTRGWIKRKIGLGDPGEIITLDGEKKGIHKGLLAYTIGQREGLELGDGPWFVAHRDFENNTLTIGRKSDVMKTEFQISDIRVDVRENLDVMVRYRSQPSPCVIDGSIVRTEIPVFAPTPGQFAVFYVGDVVIGSGVIDG